MYDPFDPQPDALTVVRITRYYVICNADPAFSSAYIQYLWPISLMQLYAGLQLTTQDSRRNIFYTCEQGHRCDL